jgi:hypothetical protein
MSSRTNGRLMKMSQQSLKLYGVPFSQPVRGHVAHVLQAVMF